MVSEMSTIYAYVYLLFCAKVKKFLQKCQPGVNAQRLPKSYHYTIDFRWRPLMLFPYHIVLSIQGERRVRKFKKQVFATCATPSGQLMHWNRFFILLSVVLTLDVSIVTVVFNVSAMMDLRERVTLVLILMSVLKILLCVKMEFVSMTR